MAFTIGGILVGLLVVTGIVLLIARYLHRLDVHYDVHNYVPRHLSRDAQSTQRF